MPQKWTSHKPPFTVIHSKNILHKLLLLCCYMVVSQVFRYVQRPIPSVSSLPYHLDLEYSSCQLYQSRDNVMLLPTPPLLKSVTFSLNDFLRLWNVFPWPNRTKNKHWDLFLTHSRLFHHFRDHPPLPSPSPTPTFFLHTSPRWWFVDIEMGSQWTIHPPTKD